jgi:glycosyltransferase involved in cell wall biosynthesis
LNISIITINYNNLIGLKKTIESVLNQSLKEFEYIIIDGNSTDGSKEYLKLLNIEIDWISEPDNGIYHAMNKGLEKSKGDFVLFLNSGDRLKEANSLEAITPFLKYDMINYTDILLHKSLHPINKKSYFKSYLHHQAIIYPQHLIIPYDEQYKFASDWLLNYTLLCKGILFNYIPIPFTIYDTTGLTSKGKSVDETFDEKLRIKAFKFPLALMKQHHFNPISILKIMKRLLLLLKKDYMIKNNLI